MSSIPKPSTAPDMPVVGPTRNEVTVFSGQRVYMPRHVVFIDSRHRDAGAYPDANRYVIHLDDTLRNVDSIELVFAVVYKFGTEDVVSLFIDEIPNRIYSNAQAVTDAFTQLPLVHYVNEYHGGYNSYQSYKKFRVPIERLSKLTISFKDSSGLLVKMLDHVLRFEIKTLERQGSIDTRYVERLAEPLSPGRALLGLGEAYTARDVHNAYANKRRLYQQEQKSSAEIQQLEKIYKQVIRRL
nr:hypothetical protein TetV2_00490 [Oceanusvirus sp.]